MPNNFFNSHKFIKFLRKAFHTSPQDGFAHLLLLALVVTALGAGVYYYSQTKHAYDDVLSATGQFLDNETLIQLNNQYTNLPEIEKNSKAGKDLLLQMKTAAQNRSKTLSKEVAADTLRYMKHATLGNIRNTFPKEVQEYLEENINKNGLFITTIVEPTLNPNNTIKTPAKTELRFLTDNVYYDLFTPDVLPVYPNKQVSLKGTRIGTKIGFVYRDLAHGIPADAPRAPTTRNEPVLVLKLDFADTEPPVVPNADLERILSTGLNNVEDYVVENTEGQLTMPVTVKGAWSLATNEQGQYCAQARIASVWNPLINQKAAQNGVNLANFKHRVYVVPDELNCATLTHGCIDFPCSGTVTIIGDDIHHDARYTYGHELMHLVARFSPIEKIMGHANYYDCGPVPLASSCMAYYNGDSTDIMGGNYPDAGWKQRLHHFSVPKKISAGLLTQADTVTATSTPTNYSVYNSFSSTSPRAIRIARGDGNYLYISYRKRINFDSTLSQNIGQGVTVHVWKGVTNSSEPELVDATPTGDANTMSAYDAAMVDGQVINDQISNVSIKQISHGDTKAVVQVAIGTPETTYPTSLPGTACIPGVEMCMNGSSNISCVSGYEGAGRDMGCQSANPPLVPACMTCVPH